MGEWRTLSSSIVSALAATRMLRKGCGAYLAHVVSTEGDVANIYDISVVSKFANVFLEDLPRLPSFRELEFDIDLAVDVRPISRVSYRMALIELKELKT